MDTRPRAKPPRAWAAEIVGEWLHGRPTAPIIEQIPETIRAQAVTLARSSCERIKSAAKNPPPNPGRALAALMAQAQVYKSVRGL